MGVILLPQIRFPLQMAQDFFSILVVGVEAGKTRCSSNPRDESYELGFRRNLTLSTSSIDIEDDNIVAFELERVDSRMFVLALLDGVLVDILDS